MHSTLGAVFWRLQYNSSVKNKPAYALESVDNALLLLHMLRDQGQVRVSEAARELGLARSTVHRLLAMLVYRDFAVHGEDRVYRPGPSLSFAYAGGSSTGELRRLLTPHMEELCERTGETVNLLVRTGTRVRFLASAESSQLLKVGDRRGTLLPAWRASGGKALLAELDDDRLEELLRTDGPVLEDAEWAHVRRDIASVRARGHALNIDGTEEGVSALGACVRNGAGDALCALTVAVPSARFSAERREELLRALKESIARAEHDVEGFTL
nr:IclR family transcriptional regulator [Nocardiopsis algeriensis]